MAQQPINPGDGSADSLYEAFRKTNENDAELYGAKTEFYASRSTFPNEGGMARVYVARDTNSAWLWDGVEYKAIGWDGATHLPIDPESGRPARLSSILAQWGIPIGIPGPGSIGVNGGLTLTSALHTVYSAGVYFYFPSGALYAGSLSGFYWTIMSSTTVGTVYNNRLATAGVPEIPSPATPIVSASIGAYVSTTAEQTLATFVLPGGLLGKSGRFRATYLLTHTMSTNNKVMRLKWNGTNVEEETIANANGRSFSNVTDLINRGREDRQILVTLNGYNGSYGIIPGNPATPSVNTAADVTVTFALMTSNANEYCVLEGFGAEVFPT